MPCGACLPMRGAATQSGSDCPALQGPAPPAGSEFPGGGQVRPARAASMCWFRFCLPLLSHMAGGILERGRLQGTGEAPGGDGAAGPCERLQPSTRAALCRRLGATVSFCCKQRAGGLPPTEVGMPCWCRSGVAAEAARRSPQEGLEAATCKLAEEHRELLKWTKMVILEKRLQVDAINKSILQDQKRVDIYEDIVRLHGEAEAMCKDT